MLSATPPILVSPLLAEVAGVRHAFFTRRGGVSRGLYASLNLGTGSRDDPAAVTENRRRAAAAFGLPSSALSLCFQVHSARVVTTETGFDGRRPEADGVVTARPGILCGALAADCAPVLIAEGTARVVGAVHAGWRGALAGVVEAAIEALAALGASRERMVAAVGPCIGPASYQVQPEFQDRFEADDPLSARFFAVDDEGDGRRFNLPGYVLYRLARAGVRRAEWIGADTYVGEAAFFSNRRALHRAENDYGRLLSAIALES